MACQLVGERVEAGEHGGEDHPGVVAESFRQYPTVRQLRALAGGLIAQDQRDAGVAQRIESGADGESRHAVEGGHTIRRYAEFLLQVEGAAAGRQLDHVRHIVDRFKRGTAVVALDQARDVSCRAWRGGIAWGSHR